MTPLTTAPAGDGLIVSGEATGRASPDAVELILNLQTVAVTASQALRDNALRIQKMSHLQANMQSMSIAVAPLFGPAAGQPTQPPQAIGYQATNTLKFVLHDMNQASVLLDGATEGGVHVSCAVVFKTSDEARVRRELLQAAARDAKCKAEVLATMLGKQLGEVTVFAEDVQPANGATAGDLTMRARVFANFRLLEAAA